MPPETTARVPLEGNEEADLKTLRARIVALEEENAALRGSREPAGFATLFEAASNPYLLLAADAPAFTIVGVNDAYLRATMKRREDLIGQALFEAFPDNPDDPMAEGVRNLRASLERVIVTCTPDRMAIQRYDIQRPASEGGGFKKHLWSPVNTPVLEPNGTIWRILHHVEDVTESQRTEAALHESEARSQALADNIPLLCWMAEPDGYIFWYNRRWYEYTGTTPEQMEGWGWQSVHDRAELPDVLAVWTRAIADGKLFEMVFPLKSADGTFRPFLTRAVPIRDDDGRIARWFGTNTEIKDIVETREALAKSRVELERLVEERTAALLREVEERRRAEEALRQGEKLQAIGQLTGGIAHDFNNILQVVSSGATLLANPKLPEARRAIILDGMGKAAQSAKELTGRLLAFARKQSLQPEAFDLNIRLEGMSELLRHTLGSRIRVETDFTLDLPLVMADPSQLEVAVLNLAVNARDAMLPEGGVLTLQTRTVWLDATSERSAGDYLCLAVKDTGPGIPPAVMARIFEPFFTTKGKGTGLGLAQVHGFAKQSRGDIAVESTPGQGTAVTIHLPRATEGQVEMPPTPAVTVTSGAAVQRAAGRTVLVVDDNPAVAAFAASMLEGLGYATCTAANAGAALALLDSGAPVDAVFSDVVMPGEINGLQLAEAIRQRYPHTALVLATGYSEVLAQWEGRAAAEVLGKPYRLEDLAAALERAFAAVGAQNQQTSQKAAADQV